MTREQALERIKEPKPFDRGILEEIKKRLAFTESHFEMVMSAPLKTYRDYPTYKRTFEHLRWLFWLLSRADLVPKSFYLKFTKRYSDEALNTILACAPDRHTSREQDAPVEV